MEFKTVIPFPPYSYRIFLIVTDNLKAVADKLAKKGHLRANHGVDDTTDGFHVLMPNQSYSYIVVKFDANIQHITHECYHAVSTMFKWIGATHEEEIFAYHIGYLTQMVVRDLEMANKKVLTKLKIKGIL